MEFKIYAVRPPVKANTSDGNWSVETLGKWVKNGEVIGNNLISKTERFFTKAKALEYFRSI